MNDQIRKLLLTILIVSAVLIILTTGVHYFRDHKNTPDPTPSPQPPTPQPPVPAPQPPTPSPQPPVPQPAPVQVNICSTARYGYLPEETKEALLAKERASDCCGPYADIGSDDYTDVAAKCNENANVISCCNASCTTLEECKQKYPCTTSYILENIQDFLSEGDLTDDQKVLLINSKLQTSPGDRTMGGSEPCYADIAKLKELCALPRGVYENNHLCVAYNDYITDKKQVDHTIDCANATGVAATICNQCANAVDLNECALFNMDKIVTDKSQCGEFNTFVAGNKDIKDVLDDEYPCRACVIAKYAKICGLPESKETFCDPPFDCPMSRKEGFAKIAEGCPPFCASSVEKFTEPVLDKSSFVDENIEKFNGCPCMNCPCRQKCPYCARCCRCNRCARCPRCPLSENYNISEKMVFV